MKKGQNVVRPYAVRAIGSASPGKAGMVGYVEVMATKECKYRLTLFTVLREGNLVLLLPCHGLCTLYSSEVCSEQWADRVLAKALKVGVFYASGIEPFGCDESVPIGFSAAPAVLGPDDPMESVKSVAAQLNLYFKEARWP